MQTISIIMPTIAGREHWLEKSIEAYQQTTPGLHGNGTRLVGVDYELILLQNRPSCGVAWNEGADVATGDFIHFTADDLVPHPAWWRDAVECVDNGAIPCPRILNTDGTLQSCGAWGSEQAEYTETDIARVPFMSREQWELIGPVPEIHYYTDNAISWSAARHGIKTLICRNYLFTHHFAPEGRGDWNARLREEEIQYRQWQAAQRARA